MKENINFRELVAILRKRTVLILFLTISSTLACGIVQYFVLTPVYQASTQILVSEKKGSATFSDIQINLQYTRTFQALLKNPVILEQVKQELHLPYSAGSLSEKIATSTESESEIINITVQDGNQKTAADIANTLTAVLKKEIKKIMNTDRVTVLSKAEIADSPVPVRPNYKMNMLLAFGAALMTGIALAFFLDFIDDTVARPSQVEKEAGFIYLGSIEQLKHKKSRFRGDDDMNVRVKPGRSEPLGY
ncbi:Wzz/FepE/Etk N-terminal domain-containing protein [Bacillus swezeyi]|uniref:Polysaccharide chain length determinant N-terminal domain-containing protein n=1 Tax=Bacillus swezeyi TaxID=1925020 RepID=A0A1R1S0C4_9BACI|nr:Wzz/FepE/Etk N-terminal domain-containing protein [Bacillus swezeyi]MEC1259520.1 Wzz/FepE/Etk N-terminal domain-containing protein [Bacillus swezeyi]MED2927517.1 Wzz/FepE/Etk N-terminal domain-containing protein [Bacillus swezeyi]MED2941773.1 Wzz/FepE/Etk N-terminal domain-containing protein [Bacillus swezeyi]MED2962715.1 Wzz/FepE/Etk N-terminal domain-containing protein [Bacillus swezeyi]MED2977323.1 Wzz/FepE/Etk N-terminal domain-containing protein [Bacillus swezeyi]